MAGFLITEHDVYWSKIYDDHGKILIENGITDDKHLPEFVRARLVPPDHDYRYPVEKWNYYVNQDILPDWYSLKYCETVCRGLINDWLPWHVFIDRDAEIETASSIRAYGKSYLSIKHIIGGNVYMRGESCAEVDRMSNGDVCACENSVMRICRVDDGDPCCYDKADLTIGIMNGGYAFAFGESTLEVRQNFGGTIKCHDKAMVINIEGIRHGL
jgi:hypothetical protein